jgi:hypothetical protein
VSTLENPAGNDKSFTDHKGPLLSETGCFPRHYPTHTRVDKVIPIGLASGLLAEATFAFQCSFSLYETVNSLRPHPKHVRDLLQDIEALSAALGLLTDFIMETADINLTALDLPLLRCGSVCKEFQQAILHYSSRPDNSQPGVLDWARLEYMGDDMDEFRILLVGYKTMFNIALADTNM